MSVVSAMAAPAPTPTFVLSFELAFALLVSETD